MSFDSPRRARLGRSSSSSPRRRRIDVTQPPPQLFVHPAPIGSPPPLNTQQNNPFQSPFGSPTSPSFVQSQSQPPAPMPTPDARFFNKSVFQVKVQGRQRFKAPDPPTKRSPMATHHKGPSHPAIEPHFLFYILTLMKSRRVATCV